MGKKEEANIRTYWDAAHTVGGSWESGHAAIAQALLFSLRDTAQRAGLPLADSVTHRMCGRGCAMLIPVSGERFIDTSILDQIHCLF